MKKVVAMLAMAAFLGGMTVNSYAQDGEKKSTTTKTEKKKCDKKCCEKNVIQKRRRSKLLHQ